MKRMIYVTLLIFIFHPVLGSEPMREPFIEISINGKIVKDGDEYTTNAGDELTVRAQISGGRRDFAQFPDTYADLDENTTVERRNQNEIIYTTGAQTYRWSLIKEDFLIETDNRIITEIVPSERINLHRAYISIPPGKIEKSYIKLIVKAYWQLSIDDELQNEEVNEASTTISLNINMNDNQWYASRNIRANGQSNEILEAHFNQIQNYYDDIEQKLIEADLTNAQKGINELKTKIEETDSIIKSIKAENPSYFTDITFIGLPSDKPIKDGQTFMEVQEEWNKFETLVEELKVEFTALEDDDERTQRNKLYDIIDDLDSWYHKLPPGYIHLLQDYIPDVNWEEELHINHYLSFNPEKEKVKDAAQTYSDLRQFFYDREDYYRSENQKIEATVLKLKVIRILDGMMKSHFSSINFAKWEDTRN